ncbi:MAG: glycosyltransferase family 2 protein [Alphaproteobacteria bacterium]|nr:MAG: glycosyltransferase family 2 protein [Alphaproteobacteria bacterium]
MTPKVSIIVVSYNTREMTLKCLETVFAETRHTPFELIVLDNASTDGSAKALCDSYANRARIICSEENVGFAAANNIAAREATGEYLLLLNPDTEVLDGAIDNLLSFCGENPNARIWGGRTLFADRSLNPTSCWSKMTCWSLASQAFGLSSIFRNSSLFNPEGMGSWDRQGIRKVDIVTGCFFLISRDFWNELGGFDKEFFMYAEEADLCLRAAKQGAVPMVSSNATIIHHGGASETIRSDKLVRLLKAKMTLIRKHFPSYARGFAEALLILWPFSRYMAHGLLSSLGRKKSCVQVDVWRDVWQRRKTWTA